ncbi:capsule assembly Wzi family protein [Aliikangiella coralliicola]|uniref:Capsule assembly Wzi family protein n=1 Tax=Aliikangiella coralliicola TaxID=2592383 RepID=A0A545TSN2_9GAMM|nr:capsule assembly Wzi family protein [Aliikangiella coralliicola]TQV80234.1 capsule assembly Wzi family protein [Aliikangiella coralliicola]
MSFYNKKLLGVLLGTVLSLPVNALSNNHYLPLKTDPLFELELEKLATVAKMPTLAKPYSLATVQVYLDKINDSHPELYRRIKRYLQRYKKDFNVTQASIEASYSTYEKKTLPNARGRTAESNISGHFATHWSFADNWNLSLGGTVKDESDDFVPHNTYLSYIHDYFQIDLGYKELWLSPLQESAMLLSTQAEPIARFSISSPRPLTDWKIRYDISFGKLEKMEGIRFGEERFPGRPGFLTMHFSGQLVDWWTIGVSRTMQFGGGERKVTLSSLWEAIIDPVNSDNCGGASDLQDCTQEIGNQQASISSKFDLDWGTPVSLYFELAGEDTNDFKPYKLGNKAYNLGLFFPYLTSKSSLLAEIQYVENGWYTHHIYQEGYRNDQNTIGHWWGDEKAPDDAIGAQIISFKYNYELSDEHKLELSYKSIYNDPDAGGEGPFNNYNYERGHELNLRLDEVNKDGIWHYDLYVGNDVFGEDFSRLAVTYRWR